MKKYLVLFLVSVSMLGCSTPKPAQPTTLTATLMNVHVLGSQNIEGDLTVENNGPNDTWIKTGKKIGGDNGLFYPLGFQLFARDAKGQSYILDPMSPEVTAETPGQTVALQLQTHTKQTIQLEWGLHASLLQPASPHGNSPKVLLPAGSYTLYVQFDGSKDDPKCIPCWSGRISSNEIPLTIQ